MEWLFHKVFEPILLKALASPHPVLATLAVFVAAFAAVVFVKWVIGGSREPDGGQLDEPGEDDDRDQDQRP